MINNISNNSNNIYTCQCIDGYILAADGFSCIECSTSNNPTWHIALCNASNNDTICSGTVINDQWILTSARCACKNDVGVDKQSLSIRFGKIKTCYYREANEIQLSASEIYCFPGHSAKALTVDIAVIKLQSPIPVNTMKQSPPLCIADIRRGKKIFFAGKLVEIFGWGAVGKTIEREATLQSTGIVEVEGTAKCKAVFKKEKFKDRASGGIMCTIANTTSACIGNYGSAIVTSNEGIMYFGGIVSKVTSVCGATKSYLAHSKLYTKVAFRWVKSIIKF